MQSIVSALFFFLQNRQFIGTRNLLRCHRDDMQPLHNARVQCSSSTSWHRLILKPTPRSNDISCSIYRATTTNNLLTIRSATMSSHRTMEPPDSSPFWQGRSLHLIQMQIKCIYLLVHSMWTALCRIQYIFVFVFARFALATIHQPNCQRKDETIVGGGRRRAFYELFVFVITNGFGWGSRR